MSAPTRTSWGVADDGSAIEIVIPGEDTAALDVRWPPMGLVRSDVPVEPIARRLELATGQLPGVIITTVDGELASGGWHRIESELALFTAERLAGTVAVHAAVIVHGGRALVVPGASFAGKSTLCVAAAEAGLIVLSDEYALVNPSTGLVAGWPRPVRVRLADGTLDRLDLTSTSDPIEVGLVALVAYEPGAVNEWAPIPAAEATIGLMSNTVCAQSRPDASLDAALAIARSAKAVAGRRGDAGAALQALLDTMAS